MKNKSIMNFILTLVLAFISISASAEDGAIRFSNNAYKQVITTDKKGDKHIDYVEPKLVLPGHVILYEIEFENISNQEVSNIVINTPIANNSKYREGSASGEATDITFSVDGKNFKKPDALTVKDKTGKSWLAKPDEYTAIRWVYRKVLKPGEKSKVTYKTEIKKPE